MTITVNGVDLFYTKAGAGPPLVLLHGNSEDHHTFDRLVPLLKDRYTCYAPDSRCHGQSGKAPAISYALMARDTAALITALGLESPVLLGASDGGIVGLLVAIGYPGLVGGLIACGANTHPRQLRLWFRAVCRLGWWATRDPKLNMMLTEPDIGPAQLAAIKAPTLILAGQRDILSRKDTERIAQSIPGARLQVLKGEGHSSYITKNAGRLAGAIAPFLAGLGQGKTPPA